jgi:hypothetical protein
MNNMDGRDVVYKSAKHFCSEFQIVYTCISSSHIREIIYTTSHTNLVSWGWVRFPGCLKNAEFE